jgi:hypothetical protein
MIKLPQFTFLTGPACSGKTTLSQLLMEQDNGMTTISFATPLREALFATFHMDSPDNRIDLRQEAIKAAPLPLVPNWTHRQFLIDYANFLKSKTSDCFLGDLAKHYVDRYKDYYTRFVFDDARTMGDVSPFINGYGTNECLLIRVERRGIVHKPGDVGADDILMKLPGIKKLIVPNNEEPEKMLDFMAATLGGHALRGPSIHDL